MTLRLNAIVLIILLAGGCYIPTGNYKLTAKVTSARENDKDCIVQKRSDGWTIIKCDKEDRK